MGQFKIFGRIPKEDYLEFSRINVQEVWLNRICTEQVSKDSYTISFDWRHFVGTFMWNYLL